MNVGATVILMSTKYKNLIRILPWESQELPIWQESGQVINVCLTPDDHITCVICGQVAHNVLCHHTQSIPNERICESCLEAAHTVCKPYEDCLTLAVVDKIPIIGRSLLIAANLADYPALLYTNMWDKNPSACDWCHLYHVDHALCKIELAWTIVHFGSLATCVNLVKCLPLVTDVQQIITVNLVRLGGAMFTPDVLKELRLPNLQGQLTGPYLSPKNIDYGRFAAINERLWHWVATCKLGAFYYDENKLAYCVALPSKDHILRGSLAVVQFSPKRAPRPTFCIFLSCIIPPTHKFEVTSEEYWSTPGLHVLQLVDETKWTCTTCGQLVKPETGYACVHCAAKRGD